jgi:hypothetical protein
MPTSLAWRKAASGPPLCEVEAGSPESLARGMLTEGLPVNPGELPTSPETGCGYAQPKGTRSPGGEGGPEGSEQALDEEKAAAKGDRRGQPKGRRAVLRVNSTDEGGEPQGSRKGRPRHPLEGRDEQVGVSAQEPHRRDTELGKDVKWNWVE